MFIDLRKGFLKLTFSALTFRQVEWYRIQFVNFYEPAVTLKTLNLPEIALWIP